MTESDTWGKDATVQAMRRVFRKMELAQAELLQGAGISMWDPRLRRWREISRAAFDRAWANAAGKGMGLGENQAGALYAQCLARTMMREGIESAPGHQSDEAIKRLVEEVFS
jgi:hypothetical protein